MASHAQALEHDDVYPEGIVGRMTELGLCGATIGTEFGGLGLGTYARIVEQVSRVWMSVAAIFNSHIITVAAVERFATPAQKEHWSPASPLAKSAAGWR